MSAYIILKEGNTNIPVKTEEVSYFKALGNFVLVYYIKGGFSKQSNGLKEWENDEHVIASGDFLRVHDSYMLNWRNVKSFERIYAKMNDKEATLIPINADGFKKLQEKFSNRYSSDSFKMIPFFLPRRRNERNDEEE